MLTTRPAASARRVGPAWLTSVATHAGLLLLILAVVRRPPVRGAASTPLRDAGIVLKQMTDEGPRFVGEETSDVESSSSPTTALTAGEAPQVGDAAAALPAASELPSASSALESTVGPGPGGASAQVASAAALTQGGGSAQRGGNLAHVKVFGLEGVGSKFVYVFDRSTSMEGPLLRAAKRELLASLESLDSVHQFAIIFFHFDLAVWTGGEDRIAFADQRHKQLAARFVEGITAFGGTQRKAALTHGLALQPDVVFFLTDNDDPMPSREVTKAIAQAQRQGTVIQAIEFGVGPAAQSENFLTRLARETGGGHVYVNSLRLGR